MYATLPEERRAQGRKAAYDTFRPRHKMATLEEEYQQNLDYYGEIARLFPELGATPQDVETAALEKVYQARHTYQLFEDSSPHLGGAAGASTSWGSSPTPGPPLCRCWRSSACRATSTPSPTALRWAALSPTPGCSRTPWGKWACLPKQCVFIDDTAQNLVGAQKLGIQPVQIRKKPGAYPCPEGMLSIDKISGILELLP